MTYIKTNQNMQVESVKIGTQCSQKKHEADLSAESSLARNICMSSKLQSTENNKWRAEGNSYVENKGNNTRSR